MTSFAFAGLLSIAFASVPVAKPLATSPKPAPAKVVAPAKPQERLIDLQVVNGDLATLLRTLSDKTGVGLVLLSPAEVKVTTNLVKVPFSQALHHLCVIAGLAHLKVEKTYVVATKERLREAYPVDYARAFGPPVTVPTVQTEVELVQTNYIGAAQLATALKSIYGERLTLAAGPVPNNPSVMGQRTDSSTGTQSLVIEKPAEGEVTSGKTLILRGERSTLNEALDLIRRMDVARPQVAIEVTIHDIADNALKELGISWSFGPIEIQETPSDGISLGEFTRTGQTFSGVIHALETKDKAKLLASPNVSVLDGERAFILIGDRLNFPVLIGYGEGNTPIFTKEEERVGIYLQVVASIGSDNQITLSLYPQVSSVTGFLNVNGASYPQISTREAQTTLRVKSGQTIVMGGLLKSIETKGLEKVPILGDLPFLGELFRRRKTTTNASQVIISITPRVIPNDEPR